VDVLTLSLSLSLSLSVCLLLLSLSPSSESRSLLPSSLTVPYLFLPHQVIQLYDTMLVRHGVMLVGPTGGGKTTVYSVLADALEALHAAGHGAHNPFYRPVKTQVLNPKSVTMGELYGEVGPFV